jgi:RHS repeat-associated protein
MDTGSQGILRGAGRRRRRGACDADNRPTNRGGTTLNYDDNGNLILEGTATYSWNARNQLSATSLGAGSYGYDAAGRRRSRTVSGISLQTLYDGWNAVQLKQAGAAVESRLFGLGLDEIYGRTNSSTSQSYLTDALGSVLSLRNPDQSAQADYTYGAYGETAETPPGASSNLIKYTGREQDTAGLYYYRNRYYSPLTDRFLSEDPIGLAGGENLYSYVEGNPVSLTDPDGLLGRGPGKGPYPPGQGPGQGLSGFINGLEELGVLPSNSCERACRFSLMLSCQGLNAIAVVISRGRAPGVGLACTVGASKICEESCKKPEPCKANPL